jgi:outer membrane protein assembly factor BamA
VRRRLGAVSARRRAASALVAASLALAPTAHAQPAGADPYDEPEGARRPPATPPQPPPATAPAATAQLAPAPPAAMAPPTAPAGPTPAAPPDGASSDGGGSPRSRRYRVRYALEGIELRGNERTADRVILRYVKFRAGDVLDVDDPEIELTKYRLLGTGFFASVQLSLRKGSRRGAAVLVIDVVERNTFIVQDLAIGVAADEDTAGNSEPLSAYLGLQVAETNLAGTGITLGAGIGLATDQLALRTWFADPAFIGSSWSARASLLYTDARDFFGNRSVIFEAPDLLQREVTDYAVVAYKRFGGSIGVGRDLGVASALQLEYGLEQVDALVPTAASHLRGNADDDGRDVGAREPIDFDVLPGKSVLSTLRATLSYDSRDVPFLTKKGTRASASLTLGVPPLGSSYGYQRVELSWQRWWQLPWKHVVRLETFAGGIGGDAPFFEKFYVGDFSDLLPDRILGLAPDRRQPPNLLGTDIVEVRYGDFAGKIEGEYRIPLYTGKSGVYGIDVFTAVGLYAVAGERELSDPPPGYHGFSRVPIDLSYNLGLRVDTSLGGLTLAFSNLLGLIPASRGERK